MPALVEEVAMHRERPDLDLVKSGELLMEIGSTAPSRRADMLAEVLAVILGIGVGLAIFLLVIR